MPKTRRRRNRPSQSYLSLQRQGDDSGAPPRSTAGDQQNTSSPTANDVSRVLKLLSSESPGDRVFGCAALGGSPALWRAATPVPLIERLQDPGWRVRQEAAGALRNILLSAATNPQSSTMGEGGAASGGDEYSVCEQLMANNLVATLVSCVIDVAQSPEDRANPNRESSRAPLLCQLFLLLETLCELSDDAVSQCCGETPVPVNPSAADSSSSSSLVVVVAHACLQIDPARDASEHDRSLCDMALAAAQLLLLLTEDNPVSCAALVTQVPEFVPTVARAVTTLTSTVEGGFGSTTTTPTSSSTTTPSSSSSSVTAVAKGQYAALAATLAGVVVQVCLDLFLEHGGSSSPSPSLGDLSDQLLPVLLATLSSCLPVVMLDSYSLLLKQVVPKLHSFITASSATSGAGSVVAEQSRPPVPAELTNDILALKYTLVAQKTALEVLTNFCGLPSSAAAAEGHSDMAENEDDDEQLAPIDLSNLITSDPNWAQLIQQLWQKVLIKCNVPNSVRECLLNQLAQMPAEALAGCDLQAHLVFDVQTRALQCAENLLQFSSVHPDVARRAPMLARTLSSVCDVHVQAAQAGAQQLALVAAAMASGSNAGLPQPSLPSTMVVCQTNVFEAAISAASLVVVAGAPEEARLAENTANYLATLGSVSASAFPASAQTGSLALSSPIQLWFEERSEVVGAGARLLAVVMGSVVPEASPQRGQIRQCLFSLMQWMCSASTDDDDDDCFAAVSLILDLLFDQFADTPDPQFTQQLAQFYTAQLSSKFPKSSEAVNLQAFIEYRNNL